MNTKWNMTFFLFLGLMGVILLIYTALNSGEGGKRPAALISCVCVLAAFTVVLLSLNNPAKIVMILGTPRKGFSGAVIMQVLMAASGLIVFLKWRSSKAAVSAMAVIVATASVYVLSKVYMVSTRPALNTYIPTVLLIFPVLQTAGLYRLKSGVSSDRAKRLLYGAAAAMAAYGDLSADFCRADEKPDTTGSRA